MSAFAPIVEEQPFDRFYKKPAASTASASATAASAATSATVAASATITTSAPRKRTIYVTMPGGAPAVIRETPSEPVREIYREPARETRETFREPMQETFREPVRETFREPAKESSVEIMPQFTPRKKARLLQPVAIGFGVLVLLAAGIFIGLSIQKDNPGLQRLASRTGSTDNAQPIVRTTAQQLPVSPVVSKVTPPVQTQQITSPASAGPGTPAPVTDRPVSKPPRIPTPKQKGRCSEKRGHSPRCGS